MSYLYVEFSYKEKTSTERLERMNCLSSTTILFLESIVNHSIFKCEK